jgi:hypothetical protein
MALFMHKVKSRTKKKMEIGLIGMKTEKKQDKEVF